MFQACFAKSFKFLKKVKFFGQNKRLLTSKLGTVFVIIAIRNNYSFIQLSGTYSVLICKKLYFMHLNKVLTFKKLYVLYVWLRKAAKMLETRFLAIENLSAAISFSPLVGYNLISY